MMKWHKWYGICRLIMMMMVNPNSWWIFINLIDNLLFMKHFNVFYISTIKENPMFKLSFYKWISLVCQTHKGITLIMFITGSLWISSNLNINLVFMTNFIMFHISIVFLCGMIIGIRKWILFHVTTNNDLLVIEICIH